MMGTYLRVHLTFRLTFNVKTGEQATSRFPALGRYHPMTTARGCGDGLQTPSGGPQRRRLHCLSPNPPKDTDGRREDSGRVGEGATGEMAGLIGVDWRSANGLQSPHRAPMALCGSCDARDGERMRSRELSRTGVARVFREVGSVAGWQVRRGVEWLAAGPWRE